MDPSGMMNEGSPFNLSEIWQFPITGDSSVNLATTTVAGDPTRITHTLSQAVLEGISGAWNRRDDESGKFVCTRNKRRKIDEVCDGKKETGSPETKVDQKKQKTEPMKDYIHVRARRGQATDSHSLAERKDQGSSTKGSKVQIRGSSHTQTEMAARKPIVCGLSAGGIKPPLQPTEVEDADDDVEVLPPTEAEVVEISDEEEEDLVELSNDEYRRSMGYLIRIEEDEDDIEPEFKRMLGKRRG